jgi:tetratricopeptide (TPR) repeat protein
MEYGEKAGKPIAAAQGYLGIAEVYAWLGRTNEALAMADKAVASYEAGNFWQGTAGTYQLIADVFADSGRPGEAFILLEKAAGLYHEGRQKDREAYTWERIALVLTQVCNSVDALRFHDMALQAFSEIGWKEEAIRITINKAFLLTELNRLDEAEPLARSAISLSEELGNPYATAGAYACLAEVMDHRGRPQEAIVASQTALGWAGKAGEPEQVAEMQGYLLISTSCVKAC